jgi:hypothetical protein
MSGCVFWVVISGGFSAAIVVWAGLLFHEAVVDGK